MINQVQLQQDCFGVLASEPRLAEVNIVNERKFRLQAGTLFSAIWMTPRGGCSGSGILVEMPKLDVHDPNVTGPVFRPILSFVCIQAGDLAFAPDTGSGLYAEDMSVIVTDVMHLLALEGIGTFKCEGRTVEPARDPEFQGTVALRVTLTTAPLMTSQTARVPMPTMTVTGGNATITCPDGQAAMWYTTDGTFPYNSIVSGAVPDSTSQPYSASFAVSLGQVVRYAAYRSGYNNSVVRQYTVNSLN